MKKKLQVFSLAALMLMSFCMSTIAQELTTSQAIVKQCDDDAITIDGVADEEEWEHAVAIKLENFLDGYFETPPTADDLSATMKMTWNEYALYLLVEVKDESLTLRADHEDWGQHEVDNIEAFFQIPNAWGDPLRTEGGLYNPGTWQIRTMVGEEESFGGRENGGWAFESGEMFMGNVKWNLSVDGGYILEVAYPWEMLFQHVATEPLDLFAEVQTIGFELTVGDADNGEKREGILAWNDNINQNEAWKLPELFGEIVLSHDPVITEEEPLVISQVTVYQIEENAVTIDGIADDEVWQMATPVVLENYIDGYYNNHPDPSDLSATMKLAWNETALFALVEVTDQSLTLRADHEDWAQHEVDNIEAFFYVPNAWGDPLRTEGGLYNISAWQIRTMVGEEESFGGRENGGWSFDSGEMLMGNIKWNMDVTGGYILEIAFPWEMLFQYVATEPLDLFADVKTIGFELTIGDADNGEKRKGILAWNDNINANMAWKHPEFFGEIILSHEMLGTSVADIAKPVARIYPNPANGFLNIEGNLRSVEVIDIVGRRLMYLNNLNQERLVLETHTLTKGIYMININEGEKVQKVIIR
jgi:hypothetical protein